MSFQQAFKIISNLPVKQLIKNVYFSAEGEVCAIGALAQLTEEQKENIGLQMEEPDIYGCHPAVNDVWDNVDNFNITPYHLFNLDDLDLTKTEAQELQNKNDLAHLGSDVCLSNSKEDQELRYKIVLEWLQNQVKGD